MSDSEFKYLKHKRSDLVDCDGNPFPPIPDDIEVGEIAINYRKGRERLYIKNSHGDIAEFKADNGFEEGFSVASSLSDLPVGKGTVLARVPMSTQELSLSGPLPSGSRLHIIVEAKNGAVVNLSSADGSYKTVNCGSLLKIDKGGIGEIEVYVLGTMKYVSSSLKPYDSWFSGVTSDDGAFGYRLNGSDTAVTAESGETVRIEELITSAKGMFYLCTNLITLDVSNLDTSNVTVMGNMFKRCSRLTSLGLTAIDTSNVTNMMGMFDGCSSLTDLDLSSFDTKNVTNMLNMFYNCHSLRFITLSAKFFRTTKSIMFSTAENLGLNEDNTDNGWLEHLATVAPRITDGQVRTIQLASSLKGKSWASEHLASLQSKGYTIA